MHVSERDVVAGSPPEATDVGWFAARQPGIVRFLEDRLLVGDGDAFGVALDASWRVCAAFEARDGVPPPRVARSLLDRADGAARREAGHAGAFADGCAQRQPALCGWLIGLLGDPPVPLDPGDRQRVGESLVAVIYALDQVTTGRPVP